MESDLSFEMEPRSSRPTGQRQAKPRTLGKTMVMDKGLGLNAFQDLLSTSSSHLDMIKIGFGTSPLYPLHVLKSKINSAKENGICIYPGWYLSGGCHQTECSKLFF